MSLSTRPWDKLFHFPIMQLPWHILEGHKCSYWGLLHSSACKVCVCSDCWRLNESQHLLQSTDNTDCKLCYPTVFLCLFLYFLSQYANPSQIQSAWTEYILDDSKNLINGPKESPKWQEIKRANRIQGEKSPGQGSEQLLQDLSSV